MQELSTVIDESMAVFSDSLIVGNHDSITLFGTRPQGRLSDYSQRLSSLLLDSTKNLDIAIEDVILEIDQFEHTLYVPPKKFFGRRKQHKDIVREYEKISSYIEKMTLYFKLQQAQMLKEIKLLEKLEKAVVVCTEELDHCIQSGATLLQERGCYLEKARMPSPLEDDSSDIILWFSRLEKRLEDLAITHTMSLQTCEQIKLLRSSNLRMLDKIASAISNTFPIWRTQTAVMLGLNLLEARTEAQERLAIVTETQIQELNGTLKEALRELNLLEMSADQLRKDSCQ